MHRIDSGTFGICDHCGGRIPEKRLLAWPTAARCLRCQADQERLDTVEYGGNTQCVMLFSILDRRNNKLSIF